MAASARGRRLCSISVEPKPRRSGATTPLSPVSRHVRSSRLPFRLQLSSIRPSGRLTILRRVGQMGLGGYIAVLSTKMWIADMSGGRGWIVKGDAGD